VKVSFTIPGKPVGKARTRRKGDSYFKDDTNEAYEHSIGWIASEAWNAAPTAGPVSLTIKCVMPIPGSWSLKKTKAALDGLVPADCKPDWDNAGKMVSDALNHIVWRDDKQVVKANVEKVYGQTPGIHVTVEVLS